MSWSPSSHRPILSLAVDALNDLDGADAVTGLWTGTSILSLPRFSPSSFLFYILAWLPNFAIQSLQNVRNPFKMVHASNTSLGDSGIANSKLAGLTNLSPSLHILHI